VAVFRRKFREFQVSWSIFPSVPNPLYRTAVTIGRGIRRLISLFDSLEVTINEADNRLQAEADGQEAQEPTTDEEIEVYET